MPTSHLPMQILDILSADRVQTGVAASSKKRLLELASTVVSKALIAAAGTASAEQVFDALLARERLGSTALGEGVAVPHCRLAGCTQTLGLLLQLTEGIDFDAPDNQPVDLLFVLVVPAQATDEHLHLLAGVAGMFNDAGARQALRACHSSSELLAQVAAFESNSAAG